LFVSGLEEVTGRNITENVTSENISMIEEVYIKSNVQGLDTGLLGILFASLGIFMTAASVVGIKG